MKKKYCFLLLVFMLFSIVPVQVMAAGAGGGATGTSSSTTTPIPRIVIESIGEREAENGEILNVKLKVTNLALFSAMEFLIMPDIESNSAFEIKNEEIQIIDRVSEGKEYFIEYEFKIKDQAVEGEYTIDFKYEYANSTREFFEDNFKLIINVLNDKTEANFNIIDVELPEKVIPGDIFELKFNLEDVNEIIPQNVKVYIGDKSQGEIINIGEESKEFPIFIGRTYDNDKIIFKLKANESLKKGDYPIAINIDYNNHLGEEIHSEKNVYITIDEEGEAKLIIHEMKVLDEKIIPGEEFTVEYTLENKGNEDGRDIFIFADGGALLKSVSDTSVAIESLAVGEKVKIQFSFEPLNTAEYANATIKLSGEYLVNTDGSKENLSNNYSVYVGEKSRLSIENIKTSKYEIKHNEDTSVSFDLINNGDGTAEDIEVTLELDKDMIIKSQSVVYIPEIKSGEKYSVSFVITATDNAQSMSYPIKISVVEQGDNSQALNQYASVYVDEDESTVKPRIIIDNYQILSEKIMAGEKFDIEFSFMNTNVTKDISNLKVYFTVEGVENGQNIIFPANQANSIFIGDLSKGTSKSEQVEMYVDSNLEMKVYNLTANFEYNDKNGNSYTDKETIAIQVEQPYEIMVSDPNITSLGSGQANTLAVNFYNLGKTDISNLLINIKGNFTAQNGEYYVGEFAIGKSDTYDVQIIPNGAGVIEGEVSFTFNTPNGETHVQTKEFSLGAKGDMSGERSQGGNAEREAMKKGLQGRKQEEESSDNGKMLFMIIPAFVILSGVCYLSVKKKRAKGKKQNA